MPDDVFAPFPSTAQAPAPGSAEIIYLRRALFVLRGMFFDPIAGKAAPLPPHRFALVHSDTAFSEGTTSDADGFSTIFEPDLAGVAPDAEWEIVLIPIYDGRPDSDIYAEHEEAWLDVVDKKWIPGDEVRGEFRTLRKLTMRKLLRLPFWSTRIKATLGGGFVGSPAASPAFADTGVLKTSELVPHGTRESPFTIQVDHGWLRTHVQLRVYDPVAKRDRPLSQGLTLVAHEADDSSTVGGSSVALPGGSIYMLSAGPKAKVPKLLYSFRTEANSWFAYADGGMDTRGNEELERLATHHPLPIVWCSHGHECWVGPGDPSSSTRKSFAELRHEGTAVEKPLCFHLDDLVLTTTDAALLGYDNDKRTIALPSTRICLLDHHLAIRGPKKDSKGESPFSALELQKYPLRAEDAVFVRGEGLAKMTRVVEYEGRLFEVTYDSAWGRIGETPLVGARAARPMLTQVKDVIDRHEVHLVDVTYLRHPYRGVEAKLAHVLVYVPAFVQVNTIATDPAPVVAQAKNEALPLVERLLVRSARVWDQQHPAHASHPGRGDKRKEYVIIPRAPLTAESIVIRVRHFMGSRKNANRVEIFAQAPGDPPPKPRTELTINIHARAGRATGGSPMQLYLETKMQTETLKKPVKGAFGFEPRGDLVKDELDLVEEFHDTLTHELGHSMGLPDEYIERFDPGKNLFGRAGCFEQTGSRPFHLDGRSLMNSNTHPRLRYTWQRVLDLNGIAASKDADHWARSKQPFVVQYVSGSTTLRYELPKPEPPFSNYSLWVPVSERRGRCELQLHRLGDDETARGPIITPPGSGMLGKPFDGVVVIVCKFWFTFDKSIKLEGKRWRIAYEKLARDYYDPDDIPKFFVEAPAGVTSLRRVLLLPLPLIELGHKPSTRNDGKLEQVGNADIEVHVFNKLAQRTIDTSKSPTRIQIEDGDVGHWLMRYALDPAAHAQTDDNDPLGAADFAPVDAWLAAKLGRARGTIRKV